MKMEFKKMHGTGNDYVYVNCMEQELPNPGAISEYISHRRFDTGERFQRKVVLSVRPLS